MLIPFITLMPLTIVLVIEENNYLLFSLMMMAFGVRCALVLITTFLKNSRKA
ncbi:hypothetical protein CLAVI_000941 [Candidatus Clavichlamydia salmonicola]|uniref:hypothetical protein n=1 Tax=Candidatus Clavichlamydia salmonicola TaxID=469812 RepID=UPI0018919072|nr:hypothetical protein [Candidatus Clavichlamydia salmonicola]MBF5051300.1 hypothetical protein [Candidatus Clavichlamydia salmonicola]